MFLCLDTASPVRWGLVSVHIVMMISKKILVFKLRKFKDLYSKFLVICIKTWYLYRVMCFLISDFCCGFEYCQFHLNYWQLLRLVVQIRIFFLSLSPHKYFMYDSTNYLNYQHSTQVFNSAYCCLNRIW